jgi:DNA-binding transcriptional MerR regulator
MMRIKEIATRLGISERALRHYEREGLLKPARTANGYRLYSEADQRRAARIRDLIAAGYGTREIRSMAECLEDGRHGPCEAGLADLERKQEQIDQMIAGLVSRRTVVADRITAFRAALQSNHAVVNHDAPTAHSFPDRLSGRRRRVSPRPNPDTDRP